MEYIQTASGERLAIPDCIIAKSKSEPLPVPHGDKAQAKKGATVVHQRRTLVEEFVNASPPRREEMIAEALGLPKQAGQAVERQVVDIAQEITHDVADEQHQEG